VSAGSGLTAPSLLLVVAVEVPQLQRLQWGDVVSGVVACFCVSRSDLLPELLPWFGLWIRSAALLAEGQLVVCAGQRLELKHAFESSGPGWTPEWVLMIHYTVHAGHVVLDPRSSSLDCHALQGHTCPGNRHHIDTMFQSVHGMLALTGL